VSHSRSGTLRLWFKLNQVAQFSRISWGTLLNFSAPEICATLVLKAADLLRRCPSDERVQDEPKVSADAARALKEERKKLWAEAAAKYRIVHPRKLTQDMVAEHIGWKDRTMVGWWLRCDPRFTPVHDREIRSALKALAA